MSRLVRFLLAALLALGVVVPAAGAAPSNQLNRTLAALWTRVLLTPDAQNPFGSGGLTYACVELGNTVAPLTPDPGGVPSCTVKAGTQIFVAAHTNECSTFEGTPADMLSQCARLGDPPAAPGVTVDGRPVPISEAETGVLKITLLADNVFGEQAGTQGLSYGHGWVALLRPLPPATHTIVITNLDNSTITTTINVTPGP